jgi:acylphosphatase
MAVGSPDEAMNRVRLHVLYSGDVQGVGFRYTAKALARGFEVTGLVRNLLDGRVELTAEGGREELSAFRQAILDSGLGPLIRREEVRWEAASGDLRGFEMVR